MKKLLTLLLTVLMTVGIAGTSVFAEETQPMGGDANVSITVIGNEQMVNDTTVDESKVTKVYAVDISWTDGFAFTYKFNKQDVSYNATTMTYERTVDETNVGWYVGDEKGDSIEFKVTNRSNDAVTVTPSFAAGDKELTGTTELTIYNGDDTLASTASGDPVPVDIEKASTTDIGEAGTAQELALTLGVAGIPDYAASDTATRAKVHLTIEPKVVVE